MSLFYRIAGLTIQTDDCLDSASMVQLEYYRIDPVEKADITFFMHTFCENIPFPEGKLIAEINRRFWYEMPDGGISFAEQADEIAEEVLNRMDANADFSEIHGWFCRPELLIDTTDRRPYHLINEVLRYALLFREGMIIHASSLSYQGKGVLFSAPSGTGKSTHTGLWLKYAPGTEIINDDLPIVRNIDGVPHLCGAPWSGKHDLHKNTTVPLAAIVFLERGTVCSLTPIDPVEAVWRMLEAIAKPAIISLAEKSLELMTSFIEQVPVYLLKCDMSEDAVRTSMQALL